MDRRRLLTLSGLLAMSVAGCVGTEDDSQMNTDDTETDDTPEPASGAKPDLEDDQLATLVAETNGFGFDLYRELLTENPDENIFWSPVSVGIALAMTYAGARGQTKAQMRDVLRYQLDDEVVHAAFEDLQHRLNERGESTTAADDGDEQQPFELSLANSAWGQANYSFNQAYLDLLETAYEGGFYEVNYRADPEDARETINDWVAGETDDRIDELLPPGSISVDTRLVLANAVYFLADWKHPFPDENTTDATFTALGGTDHEVPMMHQRRPWQYADVDGTQAVDLPYVGDDVSMLLILPPEGQFEEYEQSFDGQTLSTLVDALDSRTGTVKLPKFELDEKFRLKSVLKSLGMVEAFTPDADLSGLTDADSSLRIDEVYHDTFVAVDENETEAAAATGVVINRESAVVNSFDFVADRPFLFAIRDRPTGTVLFFGRVVDPAGWE